jgi:hypothetical protein
VSQHQPAWQQYVILLAIPANLSQHLFYSPPTHLVPRLCHRRQRWIGKLTFQDIIKPGYGNFVRHLHIALSQFVQDAVRYGIRRGNDGVNRWRTAAKKRLSRIYASFIIERASVHQAPVDRQSVLRQYIRVCPEPLRSRYVIFWASHKSDAPISMHL